MHESEVVLLAGMLVFVLSHLIPSVSGLRARLIQRYGRSAYQVIFSAIVLHALLLMVLGYAAATNQPAPLRLQAEFCTPGTTRLLVGIAALSIVPVLALSHFYACHIKRLTVSPLALAAVFWSLIHLFMTTCEYYQLALYGFMLVFGVVLFFLHWRQGPIMFVSDGKPRAVPTFADLNVVSLGFLLYLTAIMVHPMGGGVTIMEYLARVSA